MLPGGPPTPSLRATRTAALWIASCALTVIGAFLFVLQIAWLLHVEVTWLPYAVHPVAGLLGGFVVARVETAPRRAAFIGGAAAIALLAAITYALPDAFTLTAARSASAMIVLPVVALASGAASALGAGIPAGANRGWRVVTSALVAACVIQLGGRLALALGMPFETVTLVGFELIAAAATGALLQALARERTGGEAALGVLACLLWLSLRYAGDHGTAAIRGWDAIILAGASLAALAGARLVHRLAISPGCPA